MRYRKLGNTGLIVSEMCLGAMTFGSGEGMWATVAGVSQENVTDLIKTALRPRHQLHRHRGFLLQRPFRSRHRQRAANAGPAARFLRAGHQGAAAHGAGPQPDRPVALSHHGEHQRQPEAAAGRSHRPVPDPRPRSVHAAGRDARCAGRLRACRQGALPRPVQSLGLGDHQVAVDLGQEEPRALREPADVLLDRRSRHRTRDRRRWRRIRTSPSCRGVRSRAACCRASSRATTRSPKARAARRWISRRWIANALWRVLDVMRPIADDHLVSVAQVALAWLLAQPHVTSVIIGAKNQEQLLDNIAATELDAVRRAAPGHQRCLGAAQRIPAVDAEPPVGGPAGAGERRSRESAPARAAAIPNSGAVEHAVLSGEPVCPPPGWQTLNLGSGSGLIGCAFPVDSGSVTAAVFPRVFSRRGPHTDARGGLPGACRSDRRRAPCRRPDLARDWPPSDGTTFSEGGCI